MPSFLPVRLVWVSFRKPCFCWNLNAAGCRRSTMIARPLFALSSTMTFSVLLLRVILLWGRLRTAMSTVPCPLFMRTLVRPFLCILSGMTQYQGVHLLVMFQRNKECRSLFRRCDFHRIGVTVGQLNFACWKCENWWSIVVTCNPVVLGLPLFSCRSFFFQSKVSDPQASLVEAVVYQGSAQSDGVICK